MGFLDGVLNNLAQRISKSIQGDAYSLVNTSEYMGKGRGYSVSAEMSESLADLMLMLSSMPISGDTERARWLDLQADRFMRTKAKPLVSAAFGTGDALVVPSWNGRNIQNLVVDSDDFVIFDCQGDEIISCAYVVDRKSVRQDSYTLLQAVELVPYETSTGVSFANRYRMFVMRNDSFADVPLSTFPDWAEKYEREWFIPNVDRLLVARYKSFSIDPQNLNSVKGVPICFGAKDPIREIHYLLEQMHDEYQLSEKAIMADKRAFKRDSNGNLVLPHGRERLFMELGGAGNEVNMSEWAPEIRYMAYLEAIDKQERLVEKAVGVSHGILSQSNDHYYNNVDNVRKSQQKTMSFISTARKVAEDCLLDLVYAWDVLANYYQITPVADYEVSFDWSDEYIETFGDRQAAILAGNAIGATDAVDYRMFVMDESPEAARQRVEEIKAAKAQEPIAIEDVTIE